MRPQGPIEEFLAERVAAAMWRLRRAERIEQGVLASQLLELEAERTKRDQQTCESTMLDQLEILRTSITDEEGHRVASALLAEIEAAKDEDLPMLGLAFAKDAQGPGALDRVTRYQTSVERSLLRTLQEIREMQAARTGS